MTIIGGSIEPATTHTPCPWNSDAGREIHLTSRAGTAYRINTIEIQAYVERGTWKTLAFIPADEPEAQANACLMAAAAELLEALERIANADQEAERDQDFSLENAQSLARAVIAKATGWTA
jgi:hypothetical protein